MRVFIAGPYGDDNPKEVIRRNVEQADEVARTLMAMGHQVFVPQKMCQGWEDDTRLCRELFIDLCNSFIRAWAEAIFRIPGESPGADAEVRLGRLLGLQIINPEDRGYWPVSNVGLK
jgi:hypothetical protein